MSKSERSISGKSEVDGREDLEHVGIRQPGVQTSTFLQKAAILFYHSKTGLAVFRNPLNSRHLGYGIQMLFRIWTIQQPDTALAFQYRTSLIFR